MGNSPTRVNVAIKNDSLIFLRKFVGNECVPGTYNTIEGVLELAQQFHQKYNGTKPFHKHIDYFVEKTITAGSADEKDESILTHSSIAIGWAKLAKESKFSTSIKATVALRAAHYIAKRDDCPYKKHFNVAEINRYLKHPSDSGIVKADGNINFDALTKVLKKCFEPDDELEIMYVRESTIMNLLPIWDERDRPLDQSLGMLAPSSKGFAKGEWSTFFPTYATSWKRTPSGKFEPVVDAFTFLQLYYEGNVLNERVDGGELPVQKRIL